MQYESPITSDLKIMAKVKVSVHPSHADADSGILNQDLIPPTYGKVLYSSM